MSSMSIATPTSNRTASREITASAKAFTGQGVRDHKFLVRGNEVRVWDEVAGYYTTCHAMSAATCARIAKLAA